MRFYTIALLGVLALTSATAVAASGDGVEIVTIGAVPITVFTYHPPRCPARGSLLVFHGARRDAAAYRDLARPFSRRNCLIVFVPEFDRERFSNRRYQRGGIVARGEAASPASWTVSLIPELVTWARSREGMTALPCYLFGHSAGAQFLSRVAAFAALPEVDRIVIANPSSHVMPTLEEEAPYGMSGVFDAAQSETRLREYLARPVTIYLGEMDTGGVRLHDQPAAHRQGAHRLERGINAYRTAVETARERGWPLGWTIVTAPAVGHLAGRMLDAPEAAAAFGLP